MKIILDDIIGSTSEEERTFEIKIEKTFYDSFDGGIQDLWGPKRGYTAKVYNLGKEVWQGVEIRFNGCSRERHSVFRKMTLEAIDYVLGY